MRLATVEFLSAEFQIRMPHLAYFVFGVRKSGSTLLNQAVRYLAQRNDANWVSFPDKLFMKNIDFENRHNSRLPDELIHPGNVYGGFRAFPRSLLSNHHFAAGRKIVLVRDPRDALVSQYFSFAKSHYLPDGSDDTGPRQLISRFRKQLENIGIDEFVLSQAAPFKQTMLAYRSLVGEKSALVMRYEDVIFEKKTFLLDICRHFQWSLDERGLKDILHHIDLRPEIESEEKFVRKVTPGDHRVKLKPETIRDLNGLLAEPMALFGYDAEQDEPRTELAIQAAV